jgi:hypothetical protein
MTPSAIASAATTKVGIAQGALHPIAHFPLEFEVMEQAHEDFIQPAGGFADAHHVDEKGRKDAGMLAQANGQLASGGEPFADDRPSSFWKAGWALDSASEASERRIGTPALSRLAIWRENSMMSSSLTFSSK